MFACSLPVHAVLVKAVLKQVVCARASFMSMCVFGLPPPPSMLFLNVISLFPKLPCQLHFHLHK